MQTSSRTSRRIREQLDPEALRNHAQRRIEQRYGLAVTPAEVRDIERRIRLGQSLLVCRQYWARSVRFLVYRNVPLYLIFDEFLNCLVTALPINHIMVVKFKKKNKMM